MNLKESMLYHNIFKSLKNTSDGKLYKQAGNSVTVNVISVIAKELR